ncbi:putative glycoside hydrolase [bacterium]|nr:putative glycoside hydrolase [bacterium]
MRRGLRRAGILPGAAGIGALLLAFTVLPLRAQGQDSSAAAARYSAASAQADSLAAPLQAPEAPSQTQDTLVPEAAAAAVSADSTVAPGSTAAPADSASRPVPDSVSAKAAAAPSKPDSAAHRERPARKTPPPPPPPVTPPKFSEKALHYNAIYLNSGSIANDALLDKFIQRVKGTEVSGFVMDMKDDRGYLSYRSRLPLAAQIGSNTRRVSDPAALVRKLHDNGLIACARVVSFKDPLLATYAGADSTYPYAVLDSSSGRPWQQKNGELWANPYDRRVHEYLTGVVDELLSFGFDQIQMDYIRFPTDGDVGRLSYQVVLDSLEKIDVIGMFLSGVRKAVDSHRASLSVDVFGWVPWLHKNRDFNIGQDYDEIARHADVVCPMLYDSHFPKAFKSEYGRDRAYHIVREGTAKGVERRGKRLTGVQPYIQGFSWHAPYWGTRYIIQQMQAAEDSGAVGWIVWNARNDYSETWKALAERQAQRAGRSE